MDEAKLRTVAQLKEFLNATQEVKFTGVSGQDDQQVSVQPPLSTERAVARVKPTQAGC